MVLGKTGFDLCPVAAVLGYIGLWGDQSGLFSVFHSFCNVLHLPVDCHVHLHLPVELQYLNNRKTNKHENLHVYIFSSGHVHTIVKFSLTLSLLVLLIVISPNNAL